MKSNGYSEQTLKAINIRLKYLNRISNLDKPEVIKRHISNKDCSNTYKQALVNAYGHYTRFMGIKWTMPTYLREEREIQVPTEENLSLLIGQSSTVTAIKLLLMKECGLRPIEMFKIRLRDF